MPTLNIHSLKFCYAPTFPLVGTEDDTETLEIGTALQLEVLEKNLLTDPEPTAPALHASMTATSYALDPDNEPADDLYSDYYRDGIRTTRHTYEINPAWEMHTDRVSDAALPYDFPDNEYNFNYKDKRDTAEGKTTVVWFTT